MAVAALALAPLSSASGGDAEHDEARRLFLEGRALLVERRCDVALPKLQRSNELLPSPNSALLAARCLRELGRVEEAAERFAAVGADAQGRVAAGEEKYQETADAARAEGALLRATLGVLRIRVADAPAGTVVETAALRRPVAADGTAELLHRPGTVTLTTRAPSRPAVRRTVTVVAGRWTTVEVTLPPADSVAAPRATERGGASSWVLPTGVVLGGAGLVGVGVFAALGAMSQSTYQRLEKECGARRCDTSDSERLEDANAAEAQQTAANVALAAGGVALAAGAVLIVIGATRGDDPAAVDVALGPRGFAVRGAF